MLISTHKLLIISFIGFWFSLTNAFGQTIYYANLSGGGDQSGSSWSNAIPSYNLRDRIASATAGTQFWVGQGEFKPTIGLDKTVSFYIPSGVQVYGGFIGGETRISDRLFRQPSTTIFTGNIGEPQSDTDNSYHVVTFSNASSDTRIDGIVIVGGRATNSVAPNNVGGGIYNDGSSGKNSSPTIFNCRIASNSSMQSGGGIFNNGYQGNANSAFINCFIDNNTSIYDGGGVYNSGFQGVSSPSFNNCLFTRNSAKDGGAIYNEAFQGTCNPTFLNCTIADNSATYVYDSQFRQLGSGSMYNHGPQGTCSPRIKNCIIWNNSVTNANGRIRSDSPAITNNPATPIISYSDIENAYGDATGEGNICKDPLFTTSFFPPDPILIGEYNVQFGSPVIDSGNSGTSILSETDLANQQRRMGNEIDMGSYEYRLSPNNGIVFVTPNGAGDRSGSSWDNALSGNQLGARLSSSAAATQFWIAAGMYYPTSSTNRAASFSIGTGLSVYGGFQGVETEISQRNTDQNPTIFSGDIGQRNTTTDNSYHVVVFRNASASTRLDGITVRDAFNNQSTTLPDVEKGGGGILNNGEGFKLQSKPIIVNCKITSNTAAVGAGILGASRNWGDSSPMIVNCLIEKNVATQSGGGLQTDGALNGGNTITLMNCTIGNNIAASGGGIYLFGGFNSCRMNLLGCKITNNTASSGGGLYNGTFSGSTFIEIKNCLFENNRVTASGGAISSSSFYYGVNSLTVTNSTFVKNVADGTGATLYSSATSDANITYNLKNSIIQNTGFARDNSVTYRPPFYTITYSNIQGGFTGTGNIDADPLFVDPANGNYRLQPGSPSINTGDPTSTTSSVSTTDLAGNPRIDNNRIDMGAYERQTITGPILTLKEGNWNDPFTWLYQQLPGKGDTILIRHRLGLPASYVGNARTVRYDTNGQLVFSPDARLNLN